MKGVHPETKVVFFMADLRKLLPHIVEKCPNYAALIQAQLNNQPNLCFDLILYNDEATGGNLLQPDSKKKASLWFVAFKDISWLWSEAVWHPLCVVQHSDFDKIEGNFSAIVRQIVTNLLNQDLHLGVPVVLPSGHYLLRCALRFMISDLDSIRAAMSLKGSSAIRCCCFCRNAIKKNCGLEEFSDYFVDISSHDFEAFDDQIDADIWTAVDELDRQKPILSKAALKKKRSHLVSTTTLMDCCYQEPHGRHFLQVHSFLIPCTFIGAMVSVHGKSMQFTRCGNPPILVTWILFYN